MNIPGLEYMGSALLFSLVGILVLVFSFILLDKLIPENLWKEIVEHKNVALAILAASMMLGISIIIAAAIH